ncbi:MAG TPA: MFS transporter [Kofleriaceae bacterium]|jgi:sugar phosphate permease|nr:MFS transporter [Kofleriaceae bacterium]
MEESDREGRFERSEARLLWALWLSYGAFYFCRSNLAAAVPGLEHEAGLSKTEIGWILGSLKFAYGVGQLINGQLAERIRPRVLLAIGMFASAALNILFGFATGLYFLLFVWAVNGYAQSLGWPSTMRVTANWFPAARRGRAIGIIGTGYQLIGSVTFVVSGWAADSFGWRGALFVPAGLLVASGIHMLVILEERPPISTVTAKAPGHEGTWRSNFAATVTNGRLWLLALALGLLNACRYGFVDWGITHLREVQAASLGASGLKYSVLPAGGIIGTLVAGWATDRFFGGRRIPVIVAMLLVLAALVVGYDAIIRTNVIASTLTLAVIGALIFGPQVLLVGTTPVDFAKRGAAAAACGFVDFFGYLGAAGGDQVTGYLVDHHSWKAALTFWAVCPLGAAVIVAPLWRVSANRRAPA